MYDFHYFTNNYIIYILTIILQTSQIYKFHICKLNQQICVN